MSQQLLVRKTYIQIKGTNLALFIVIVTLTNKETYVVNGRLLALPQIRKIFNHSVTFFF